MKGKKVKQIKGRQISLAFVCAILGNLVLAVAFLAVIVFRLRFYPLPEESLIWLSLGVLVGLNFVPRLAGSRVRVFLHELRHSIGAVLFGGKINKVEIGPERGEVEFEMPESSARYYPFICLAPYFFPVFSPPILVIVLLRSVDDQPIGAFLIGMALAIDAISAFGEIHAKQTDFRSLLGGFPVASMFLVTFFFMWSSLCLLLVVFIG